MGNQEGKDCVALFTEHNVFIAASYYDYCVHCPARALQLEGGPKTLVPL